MHDNGADIGTSASWWEGWNLYQFQAASVVKNQPMKKLNIKHFFVIVIIGFLLITVSCDLSKKCALFNIYNCSSHTVTDFITYGNWSDEDSVYVLEAGENYTLMYTWIDGGIIHYASIRFNMNEENYGTLLQDEINADNSNRFKTPKRIKDGDIVNVKIYDDHWEW